jgi:hydroxymethylpyrimidine/phosphomethylpyrimidine kinase
LYSGTALDSPQSQSRKTPVALTIAGFDPSSGAGITADLQVFAAHRLFGTACITALTVQSTQGVAAVESVSSLITPTLSHLHADLPPAGIKIGILGTAEAVLSVAAYIGRLALENIPVVLDPAIISSSGASLIDAAGLEALQSKLLPLVHWITPNTTELAALSGLPVDSLDDVIPALHRLHEQHPHLHIVATGGHFDPPVDTLMTPTGEIFQIEGIRVESTSTHGTGCAFASALLANLLRAPKARPRNILAAAKSYVAEAIRRAPSIGHGHGPLGLLWPLTP